MKPSRLFFAAALLCLGTVAAAQAPKPQLPVKDYQFTTVKELPVTSIKNQYRSGTCWCFSAISFLESEVIRNASIKDPARYPDLSEMFVVRYSYHDRGVKYIRLDGKLNFAQGSDFGDVLDVVKDYGIVPQDVYTGMNYGTTLPVQGELNAGLTGYLDGIRQNPNRSLTPVWTKGFDGILDAYLGVVPETFEVDGKTYTPESYRDALGIKTEDYIGLTSFTHHPFYESFAIEVEDNWRWTQSWNLPLDEFMAVIDNAVENGYTVLWGGDVSEPGFTRDGLGVLLDTEIKSTAGSDQEKWTGKAENKEEQNAVKELPKEASVTQESRQKGYDNKTSTDDHGMHLYGIAKDQNGTKYYLIKNSWGETGHFKGIWYMSENFCKAKALNIVVHKDALPKDIRKKLGIR